MKFSGQIGFVKTEERTPGSWLPVEDTRPYIGDVERNYRRWEPNNDSVNDDIRMNNRISIVADSYLKENLGAMRFVVMNGVKWAITSFEIEWPRIVLEIGGVYNG